jgi:hypothetical protein
MKLKRPEVFDALLKRTAYDISDPRIVEFLDLVSRDHPVRNACLLSGINHNTMKEWLKPNGARFKPSLFQLFQACKKTAERQGL